MQDGRIAGADARHAPTLAPGLRTPLCAASTIRLMHSKVTEEIPLACVRDEHISGAAHRPRLVPQHALERARAAQQRTHARHQLRLCLTRSFPGICRPTRHIFESPAAFKGNNQACNLELPNLWCVAQSMC